MLVILIKPYSYGSHSHDQTSCRGIRKNRRLLLRFRRLFCFLFPDDPPECFYRVILDRFLFRTGNIRNLLQHIRLHLRIFFIVQIISCLTHKKIIFVSEKGLLLLRRIHQHKYLFSPAKMPEMYSLKKICSLHWQRPRCKKPSGNFLPLEIFLKFLMNTLPHFFRKINVFCGNFRVLHSQSASDKYIGRSADPFALPCKDRQTAFVLPFVYRTCFFLQKSISIILHIDSVIFAGLTDLTYILRHRKHPFTALRLLFLIFIDDLYHMISPLRVPEYHIQNADFSGM